MFSKCFFFFCHFIFLHFEKHFIPTGTLMLGLDFSIDRSVCSSCSWSSSLSERQNRRVLRLFADSHPRLPTSRRRKLCLSASSVCFCFCFFCREAKTNQWKPSDWRPFEICCSSSTRLNLRSSFKCGWELAKQITSVRLGLVSGNSGGGGWGRASFSHFLLWVKKKK